MIDSTFTAVERAMAKLGYDDFTSPEQRKLIGAVTSGKDALGILPTGGGKSACFIIPTIARNLLTLVVTPTISLMDNQSLKLQSAGVKAFAIHSEVDPGERLAAKILLTSPRRGPMLIYASPEMLLSEQFKKFFGDAKADLLAIDEAHCVSMWGERFRPSYLQIREIARRFNVGQCVALSATIDPRIQADVVGRLPLKPEMTIVRANPYRPNLELRVETPGAEERFVKERFSVAVRRLLRVLASDTTGAAIVYCYSREQSFKVYDACRKFCQRRGQKPILYHAEIPAEDKLLGLETFMSAQRPVVFATTAFGMGIDRPDVRLIVNFDPPSTLVDYAQMIGRAGRDQLPARCITFYDERRVRQTDKQMTSSIPSLEFVEGIYEKLVAAWQRRVRDEKFSVAQFTLRLQHFADKTFAHPDLYKQLAVHAIGLLRKVGYIIDGPEGVQIRAMNPGGTRHQQLIAETLMSERRQERETARIRRFFEHEAPTQALLWNILGEE